jgi:RecB family exonuclease
MELEFPQAHPAALGTLSPTAANDLIACGYRLALRLDKSFTSLRRPSPLSELGVVVHAVAEDVANGLLNPATTRDDAKQIVETAWKHRIEAAGRHLNAAWPDALPPAPHDWPGYHLIHVRTIRRALQVFDSRSTGTTALRAQPQIEDSLADPSLNLAGRPDRVEGPPGNRTVVDLKTGLAQSDASPEQRRQLLLYAHLVQASTGDLPRQMAIEDAAGRRWQEPVTPELVNAAVAEVMRAREEYERAENRGILPSLARPAPDTCRWCPYRPVCEAYWANLMNAWRHGSIAGITTSESVGATIEIDAASPADSSGRRWTVSTVPASVVTAAARPIAIVDAELTGAADHLRWRWRTTAWMLDPVRVGRDSNTHG